MKKISFSRLKNYIPHIWIGISGLKAGSATGLLLILLFIFGLKLETSVSAISERAFNLTYKAWGGVPVNRARVYWIAYPNNLDYFTTSRDFLIIDTALSSVMRSKYL